MVRNTDRIIAKIRQKGRERTNFWSRKEPDIAWKLLCILNMGRAQRAVRSQENSQQSEIAQSLAHNTCVMNE